MGSNSTSTKVGAARTDLEGARRRGRTANVAAGGNADPTCRLRDSDWRANGKVRRRRPIPRKLKAGAQPPDFAL